MTNEPVHMTYYDKGDRVRYIGDPMRIGSSVLCRNDDGIVIKGNIDEDDIVHVYFKCGIVDAPDVEVSPRDLEWLPTFPDKRS